MSRWPARVWPAAVAGPFRLWLGASSVSPAAPAGRRRLLRLAPHRRPLWLRAVAAPRLAFTLLAPCRRCRPHGCSRPRPSPLLAGVGGSFLAVPTRRLGSGPDPVRGWVAGLGRGEELGSSVVGVDPDLPGGVVDDSVVVAAQQDHVLQAGFAAVGPVGDVVGVAHDRGPGAAGEGAVGVAADQGPPDRRGDEAVGAADVEDLAAGAEGDGDEVGVAGQPADRRPG